MVYVKSGKVLVIDDEPLVRETVGRVLTAEGYTVELAHNGQDAIARLHAGRPDAILLDLMMPGMNGRQFLTTLRSDLGLELPVVVMTAVHGLGPRAMALGATDVIEKPFDLEKLLNKVALAVFRSQTQPAPELPRPAFVAPADLHDRVVAVIAPDLAAVDHLDRLLSAAGYTVVVIARISEQLPRLLRALSPAAIVLDVESTEDRGAAITSALRDSPALAAVPLLLFTRTHDAPAEPTPGGPTVALTRPDDTELLRTIERMCAAAAAAS